MLLLTVDKISVREWIAADMGWLSFVAPLLLLTVDKISDREWIAADMGWLSFFFVETDDGQGKDEPVRYVHLQHDPN